VIEVPVSSLVTDASVVDPETSAMEAAGYLRQPGEPALVVRDGGEVVGVVTDSDIVAVVAEGGSNPPVTSFMSSPVVTIPPSTQVGLAADRMRDAGVGLLPVVEGDGTYRGVVTKEALAPYLSRHRLEITWDSDPLTLGGSDGADSVEMGDIDPSDAHASE
jgi:CBS domain-containing protein